MLKNLNENRVERVGDALKVESVLTKEREFPQWGQKQEYESWIQDYDKYKDHLKTRRKITGEFSVEMEGEIKSRMFKMLGMTTTFDEAREYFKP